MVYLPELWLPILLSAVTVFVASSIIHMLLPYHKGDYQKLPGEERLMDAIREERVSPGNYSFPRPASMKDMNSPEMLEKVSRGPVGMLTLLPSGPPAMGKALAQWFAYCLLVGWLVAYLTGRTLEPGAAYLEVFRVAGTTAFLAHSVAHVSDSIWVGQAWSTTLKNLFDGLIYGLLTGGVFGWLWP